MAQNEIKESDKKELKHQGTLIEVGKLGGIDDQGTLKKGAKLFKNYTLIAEHENESEGTGTSFVTEIQTESVAPSFKSKKESLSKEKDVERAKSSKKIRLDTIGQESGKNSSDCTESLKNDFGENSIPNGPDSLLGERKVIQKKT